MKLFKVLSFVSIFAGIFILIYRQSETKGLRRWYQSFKITVVIAAIAAGLIPQNSQASEYDILKHSTPIEIVISSPYSNELVTAEEIESLELDDTVETILVKGADAFTPQHQTPHSQKNRSFSSRAAKKPSSNGPGKPNGGGGDGDDDNGMPEYPKVESVQETESRVDNMDEYIARMEESSDSEEEQCEATEQFQVDESYKSNSALKKITEKAQQNVSVMNDVFNVKKMLAEGADPMKSGRKPTKLGNDFYYIRKSDARIIVKLDQTTGNSDIVAVAPRSNTKIMAKFSKAVNSELDTKIKINPKAY